MVSVNALASAASAAPVTPRHDSGRHAPPPTIRTYDFSGVVQAARWYAGKVATKAAAAELARRPRPAPRTVRVSHGHAIRALSSAGFRWKSSGRCVDRRVRWCTSLQAVRSDTIHDAIALKRASGCPIMVTGGTEAGHAPGHFSHARGYKLDIAHNGCIDRFITGNYPRVGVRSDGSRLYRSPGGTVFADESDHWDILFR
ncbi:hypothetical protein [Nonomuraea sp. NPDC050310]|uniref:hypothetical protein n=1 Tax=unclassified Nonomuraea TaxID=2593643 RepID=UPI0033F3D56D